MIYWIQQDKIWGSEKTNRYVIQLQIISWLHAYCCSQWLVIFCWYYSAYHRILKPSHHTRLLGTMFRLFDTWKILVLFFLWNLIRGLCYYNVKMWPFVSLQCSGLHCFLADLKLILINIIWTKNFIISFSWLLLLRVSFPPRISIEPISITDSREPLSKGLKKKLFYPLLMRFLL